MYRGHWEGPGGPPTGATGPRGLREPSVGGDQPQVGWCAPPQGPKAPRVWGGGASTLLGGQVSPSPPLGCHPRWVFGAAAPLGVGTLKGAQPPPSPLYILEVLGMPYTRVSTSPWRSPTSLSPPLPWWLAKPYRISTLLHHNHAVVMLLDGVFPNLSLSPCWIKAWETSPSCTCVERGGAVRSALGSPVIWITTSTTPSTLFS